MESERIDGIGHQFKGAVKRALGRMIGDAKVTADGAAEQARGDAQVATAPSSGQLLGIDIDRIKGVAHQLEGAMKEGIGAIIADPVLRQAGSAERAAGKVQNALGSVRDSARDAAEKTK